MPRAIVKRAQAQVCGVPRTGEAVRAVALVEFRGAAGAGLVAEHVRGAAASHLQEGTL